MRTTTRTTKPVDNLGDLNQKEDEIMNLNGETVVMGKFEFTEKSHLIFKDGNEKEGYVLTSDNDGNIRLERGVNVPSLPYSGVQFNNGGKYGASEEFIFDLNKRAITLGKRGKGDIGANSFSNGLLNIATAVGSFAQGKTTQAEGEYSHAEGFGTKTFGKHSHAEGYNTVTKGDNSHTEGNQTEAQGEGSHAEGNKTFSFGKFSHAEGDNTRAKADFSHAEGISTLSTGVGSHSQGIFTKTVGEASFSSGNGILGKEVLSFGNSTFNHSYNDEAQGVNHGARANFSAILGGKNHNIGEQAENSVILGGEGIKLEGYVHKNSVAVPQLAIFEKPLNGYGDQILTWDEKNKIVRRISKSVPSDIRLKQKIQKKENVLPLILQLEVYQYENGPKMLPLSEQGKISFGLVSQEVEKVVPELVKDDVIINDVNYKGIDNDNLIVLLLQSIKELNNKIIELQNIVEEHDIKLKG